VLEFTNIFHTLRTKLGIKYFEQHLVLKYRSGVHRYIQDKMDFLDIKSLGMAYRYVIKIEQNLKQKTWKIGPGNPSHQKQVKGSPNLENKGQRKYGQPRDNQSRPQAKKDTKKTKKDMRKWCDFHKSPWHNTVDCRFKQSLMVEVKSFEPDVGYNSKLEPKRGR
jgi:hypothetical protein